MSTEHLGLVGHAELAQLMSDAGVEVVTGASVKEAAGAIKAASDEVGYFPIIIEDSENPGLANWAPKVAAAIPGQVAVLCEQPIHILDESILHIAQPATLAQIGEAVGLNIDSDELYPQPVAEEHPVLPDFGDDIQEPAVPETTWDSTQTSVLPAEPAPAPQPAQTPVQGQDSMWDSTNAAQPSAPAVPQQPVHQPVAQPQAPVQPQYQQPVQQNTSWDSSHQLQQPAVPQAPVQPQYQQPQYQQPVQHPQYQQPQPAPVQQVSVEQPQQQFQSPYPVGGLGQPQQIDSAVDEMSQASRRRDNAPVILSIAGKGGVGKTTAAIQIATTAARNGLKTILIDGNRGQGDIPDYLALGKTAERGVPTIADYLDHSNASATVISAANMNTLRPESSTDLPETLGVVMAPDDRDARLGEVTPQVYMQVISELRKWADIIVVDTQIIEADDPSGMVTNLVIPSLAEGGYALALSDKSNPGVKNLAKRLNMLAESGVDRSRMLISVNMVPEDDLAAVNDFCQRNLNAKLGFYLGAIGKDPEIEERSSQGETNFRNREFGAVMVEVIQRVTGREVSAHPEKTSTKDKDTVKKKGFLDKLFGGRR